MAVAARRRRTQPARRATSARRRSRPAAPGGNGNCFTTPGKQTARVRFVNLFTNSTYPKGDIDVLQGFSANDACGKKLATVAFGTASDYIDVTASDESGNWSVIGFPAGSVDSEHAIVTQSETWKGGEQVTIVFMGQDPTSGNGASAGADQVFFEKDASGESATTAVAPVPGKAAVGIGAASIQYVVKDGAWRAGRRHVGLHEGRRRHGHDDEQHRRHLLDRVRGRPGFDRPRSVPERSGHVCGGARHRSRDDRRHRRFAHDRARVRLRRQRSGAARPARSRAEQSCFDEEGRSRSLERLGPLAQLAARRTFNPQVPGSSPGRPTL